METLFFEVSTPVLRELANPDVGTVPRVAVGATSFRPLAALLIAALALRPQLVGLGPLLPAIQGDLGVSHTLAGLLTTVPVLCMALFALPAVRLAHRIGLRNAMTGALATITIFGVLRALAPSYALILVATIGIGIGIAVGGALLPRAVRIMVPARTGFATGLYSGGIQTGAAIAAATAAPLAILVDWRFALAVFSVGVAFILAGWLATTRSLPRMPSAAERPRIPWGSTAAWRMTAIFALHSLCYYGLITWLPTAFVDAGWTEESAGRLVAILNLSCLPATLTIPWLSDRATSRHRYILVAGVITTLAIAGIELVPAAVVVWVIVGGLALGALFPLSMTMPIDVGQDRVAGHAAMMLAGGFGLAAVAPALLGWVRDATGSFDVAFWILAAASAILCLLAVRRLGSNMRAA
ncbi:MAG TPA: MFS transporter [Candidatus Limnocylindria bacterium]|nr:MFS transporter [Candidatus Limnocylindria bacterium]